MSDVSRILNAIDQDEPRAAEELLPLVYKELRQLAARKLRHEAAGHTLQATALVHEAYLRLVDQDRAQAWNSRGHFFAAAAEAMRRILVENARRKTRVKHGGSRRRLPLERLELAVELPVDNLIALDEALTALVAATLRQPSWSTCTASPAYPSKRPPRSWAARPEPPTATGPSPAPGCTASWGEASRSPALSVG
jgi:RNA polymerase sigma factor (TIGR02999 family)